MTSPVVARILAKACVAWRVHASSVAFADDVSVERPAPGAAPTAFRIWTAGENPTSKGTHTFSRRSADLLLADQAVRGNLYSVDVDHMSLSDTAPPEHHRAVGWHRLAVRETASGPELWAVDVEWTPEVRAALESTPPGFRYFSPAYDVSRETNEVVGYCNTALTNNPATYQVTALATRQAASSTALDGESTNQEQPMTYKDAIAALMGDDEEKKEAAKSAIKAAFGEEEGEKKPDDAEEKKDAKASDDAEEKKDSEGEDEEEKKKAADDESKKDTVAASLDAKAIEKLVDAKLRVISETAERDRLLASRKDVGEKMLAALKSEPLAHVRKMLDAMPVTAKRNPAGDTSVKATRGDGQGEEAARLDASEKAKLDERMGLTSRKTCIEHVKNKSFFHAMTRDNAQRVLAAKGGK